MRRRVAGCDSEKVGDNRRCAMYVCIRNWLWSLKETEKGFDLKFYLRSVSFFYIRRHAGARRPPRIDRSQCFFNVFSMFFRACHYSALRRAHTGCNFLRPKRSPVPERAVAPGVSYFNTASGPAAGPPSTFVQLAARPLETLFLLPPYNCRISNPQP